MSCVFISTNDFGAYRFFSEQFSSAIPRPNRSSTQARSLHDITASANNAPSGTMMPPPGGELPKRKTLAERAGETKPTIPRPGHAISKSISSVKPSSREQQAPYSSNSSRNPSVSSRTTSRGSSNSSTTGGSARTLSSTRNIPRPQTSFGYALNHGNQPSRPATSMDTQTQNDTVLGKRKGTNNSFPFLSSSYGGYDKHLNYTSDWPNSPAAASMARQATTNEVRNFSLCTAMSGLSLNSAPSSKHAENEPQNPPSASKLPRLLPSPRAPSLASLTSHLLHSPKRQTTQRSPPKMKQFLTRYSQVQDWDQDAKMQDINAMFQKFVSQLEGTSNHSAGMKEAIDMYKSRGKLFNLDL